MPTRLLRTGDALSQIGWETAEPCCCVAAPQDAGRQATQTGADREADASSLGFGKSVSACVSAHMHAIFPLPLPSHSELPSSPRCP